MYALALDTTTLDGSVALAHDDRIVAERRGDAARGHAERLPHDLVALVTAHGLTLGAIDLFAVAAGPGSFTGLRIGIATVQGLAVATGRRVVAVSALDALARSVQAAASGEFIAAWMDARRGDVFAALYRATEHRADPLERLAVVEGPTVGAPAATLVRWRSLIGGAPATFVGDGAAVYAGTIEGAGAAWRVVREPPLLAGTIALMAVAQARAGRTIDPAAVQPLYVRRPDAEIDRDRRGGTPTASAPPQDGRSS